MIKRHIFLPFYSKLYKTAREGIFVSTFSMHGKDELRMITSVSRLPPLDLTVDTSRSWIEYKNGTYFVLSPVLARQEQRVAVAKMVRVVSELVHSTETPEELAATWLTTTDLNQALDVKQAVDALGECIIWTGTPMSIPAA